jgi:hypothetical protein
MKCWNSTFNVQGSGVIIVAVQLGAVQYMNCSSSGGAQERGKTEWNSVYHKLMVFLVPPPPPPWVEC